MDDSAKTHHDVTTMLELARERDFDALETAWMKRIESDPHDLKELYRVPDYLVRRKFPEQAEVFLWSLIIAVTEHAEVDVALAAAKRAVCLLPESASLREELITLYRKTYGDLPGLENGLSVSGLAGDADPVEAIDFIERCIRLKPGAYVLHVRSRRPGRIAAFREGRYIVESEGAERALTPSELPDVWESTDPDDLRASIIFEKDKVLNLAENEPVKLVELAVRSCNGRADFKQLKQALIPDVIPADGWTAWWNRVKVDIRRSPRLDVGGSKAQPQFTLREEARGYSDKIRTDVHDASDDIARIEIVLSYLNEVNAGHDADDALAADLADTLIERAAVARPALAIALLSAVHEVRRYFPDATDAAPLLMDRLNAIDRLDELIKDFKDELSRVIFNAIKDVLPEGWPAVFAAIFPGASVRLCDVIVRDLAAANRIELLKGSVEEVVALPEQYADAFAWVWRQSFENYELFSEGVDRLTLTSAMLHVINRLARLPRHAANREEARQKLTRLRNTISANNFGLLCDLITTVDIAGARRLHRAIAPNEALTEHARLDLIRALEDRYPEEFIVKKPLWDDGNIYTTPEGLALRQAQFEKLANEDIPRNARAIGDAAAKGDLRENWEYKAALEERDRLVERTSRAREDLDAARLIPAETITGEEVNIGTRIHVSSVASGTTRTMTFLGPWDADIANGVYSYQAPVSQRFMGARVGDTVRAILGDEDAEHRIESIEKVV